MTIVRKEYRKPYMLVKGGYPDMMRATWEKSVWNNFLDTDPRWAEFLFLRSEIPDSSSEASARRLRYLKQSEFKKPYSTSSIDYPVMEYLWTGPIPGIDPRWFSPGSFSFPDFPWVDGDGPDDPTTYFVCDADCGGLCCYCEGSEKDIPVTATYPIVGVEPTFSEGEELSIISGIGTNSAVVRIKTPSGRVGQMIVDVFMMLPNGNVCNSSFNIYPCSEEDCCGECDLEYDFDTSDETIVAPGSGTANVTGGTPPFTWSISSEDGLWTLAAGVTELRTNTVNAAAGACGSATITVKDGCDNNCQTTGSMRNPSDGSWVQISSGHCQIPGAPDGSPVGPGAKVKTQGKYQQRQTWSCGGVSSTGGCNSAWDCAAALPCSPGNGTQEECITFICPPTQDDQQVLNGLDYCCNRNCSHIGQPSSYAREIRCCWSTILTLWEWKC
jgi:hypothetical protein